MVDGTGYATPSRVDNATQCEGAPRSLLGTSRSAEFRFLIFSLICERARTTKGRQEFADGGRGFSRRCLTNSFSMRPALWIWRSSRSDAAATSRTAKIEKHAMFLLGTLERLREIELKPRVTVPVVVDGPNDGHEMRAVGARVQRGVKVRVQASPRSNLALRRKLLFVGLQDGFGFLEVGFRQIRNGNLQHGAFEKGADVKQFLDFVRGERGNHRAAMGDDLDKSLRFELAQGFTDGNAADAQIERDSILAELLTFLNFSPDDHFAQLVGHCRRERHARNAVVDGAVFSFCFCIQGHEIRPASMKLPSGEEDNISAAIADLQRGKALEYYIQERVYCNASGTYRCRAPLGFRSTRRIYERSYHSRTSHRFPHRRRTHAARHRWRPTARRRRLVLSLGTLSK